jgi:hypothetical protein
MNDLDHVLEYVNNARKALILPIIDHLPLGRLRAANHCPIANALEEATVCSLAIEFNNREDAIAVHLAWYGNDIIRSFDDTEIRTPEVIANFIEDFDARKYPELIEKEYETK